MTAPYQPLPSSDKGEAWNPTDFWQFVSGLAGEHEADQIRDMLAQKGLQIMGMRDLAYTASDCGAWHKGDGPPPVENGQEREFIVAVRRAHSGKIYSFAASYLNAAPLRYDYCPKDKDGFCAECEDGCPTTGWFVQTGDDGGTQYNSLGLDKGDEFMGWRRVPQWEDGRTSEIPSTEGNSRG